MIRILVTGATGGLGANVVAEAAARGLAVRALVRDPARAKVAPGVEVVKGDALDAAALTRALEGCDALFHLVNVVIGKAWVDVTARLLEAAITACTKTGTRLVFPANVWIFGRGRSGELVDETRAPAPCSELGRARANKEARLRASGVRFAMVRLPEFYGPHVQTLTGPPLRRIAAGRTGIWFGPPDVEVELVLMPDAARVLLDVGLADDVDGETFHYPGAAPITPRAFFAEARRIACGGRFLALPALAVRAAALVSPVARSFADIFHLWEAPILLDGKKLGRRFPHVRTTPYAEGLAATIAWLRQNPGARMYG
ncbi:MAG: NAD(P)H-binding protein [Polyangiaceae bacterium]|nr:NAD(P)H-binding protein [Polyangiaceae bacterium]